MYDTNLTNIVNGLSSFGYKPSKAAQSFIDSVDAIEYAYDGRPTVPNVPVTEGEEAEALLYEFAGTLAGHEKIAEARRLLRDAHTRQALEEIRKDSDEILALINKIVTEAGDRLTAAVSLLPERLTSEDLVAAGATAVAAYADAEDAGQVLQNISLWIFSNGNSVGVGPTTERAFQLVRPDTAEQYAKIKEAQSTSASNVMEQRIGRVFLCAARVGADFSLNDNQRIAEFKASIGIV
ncbi:hypothetical protein Y710_00265 [Gordonia sp. QH-12]|uniref:hypothetical protein n=1 Tax=Gordonia sp. QH-12 TaxID=1437876 RepID=UPI0007808046|nr:hypothetical protein [Gordonia sp. QH-12]KXT58720.1 hypothetical protein Y710_00265 [Gordonia sp. QH-12]